MQVQVAIENPTLRVPYRDAAGVSAGVSADVSAYMYVTGLGLLGENRSAVTAGGLHWRWDAEGLPKRNSIWFGLAAVLPGCESA